MQSTGAVVVLATAAQPEIVAEREVPIGPDGVVKV